MAIAPSLTITILLFGDGTSTTVTLNFDDIPVIFAANNTVQPDFNFKGLHPATVIPTTLDTSTINLPTASVSGTDVTFTFPTALAAGNHRLDCVVTF